GKVPIGVARRAKKANVDVIAVVGTIGQDIDAVYDMGITAIFSINPEPLPYEIAKLKSKENLALTMENIVRMLKIKPQQ
ncbi:MAG: glycerate kinase, partial [Erysipelotrichaceae bacterium]|nr:glycerate kinase [Erysipelotrichaceae bacterium]